MLHITPRTADTGGKAFRQDCVRLSRGPSADQTEETSMNFETVASKPARTVNRLTGTVELIVTPEMRLKRRILGQELRAQESGEVDLGDIGDSNG